MTLAGTQAQFWAALRGEEHTLHVRGHLDVYAQMFLWRQIDALRADFPETAEHLGEQFSDVARAYVLAHPSEDADLGRLGRRFAEFTGLENAALEWARSEVFLEAEAPRVTAEEFVQTLAIHLAPALRLVGRTVVWREPGGFALHEVDLPEDEAAALRLALAGAPFAEVCGVFGEPARAFEALQSWLAEGWLTSPARPA